MFRNNKINFILMILLTLMMLIGCTTGMENNVVQESPPKQAL
ncbi:hypothetical protein Amet_1747 [Alkaliphilus metalliredigens QYMF]|uniref:Uncharacterized protein n=1 Tax=Alkaliphilus metalliredigens (strain QYMF) TaxID=293826 RepID=A6TP03_ALKMQ|nr:hypothetical protein [Alkaliphilus metalliredigens]ABR47921.1 hypothetical protein Amet_1747 [Alkaliphilus metalliredigens QYMF]